MVRVSISKKIYIPLIASIVVGLFIALMFTYNSVKTIEHDVYAQKQESLRVYTENQLNAKYDIALTNAITIASNHSVVQSLLENRREIALEGLGELTALYQSSTDYKNVQIHIHTSDIKSFVRSWMSNKFGDDLSSFRHPIS